MVLTKHGSDVLVAREPGPDEDDGESDLDQDERQLQPCEISGQLPRRELTARCRRVDTYRTKPAGRGAGGNGRPGAGTRRRRRWR